MDLSIFARRESAVRSYCRGLDVVFDTAHGSTMIDSTGTAWLDFLAGAGSLNYGHNDPDMRDALVEHLTRGGLAHGLDLHTSAKASFLKTFEGLVLAPRGLDHRVQFTGTTGTNAVEAALKLARKVTGRSNVIAFTNGFHGVSLGALAATGNRHHRTAAGLHDVTRMPYVDYVEGVDTLALLERMLSDTSSGMDAPAAILLETVQGEGGLNVASPAWLRRVATLAREHGALLIVDDIQAGCGRTGTFFSFEPSGIVPDLITLSKSISGFGLPLAMLLIRPDLDQWSPGEHNGTFRGNQHAFVTARVALEKFWADGAFARDIARRTDLVRSRLDQVVESVPGTRVKGRGLMIGLEVGALSGEIQRRCHEQRLVIETAGPDDEVVKVFAPLTTADDELYRGLDILDQAVRSAVRDGGALLETA